MLKKLRRRDRIALVAAATATGLFVAIEFGVLPLLDRLSGGSTAVEEKELALRRSQRLVASATAEQTSLADARERLTGLESGLLESPSPSLANAEWQRLVREFADKGGLALGSTEFLRMQDLGPDYVLVVGRVTLRCRLDQLVDFMAALATAPRLLSVTRLRVAPIPGETQKRMNVEMMVAATMRAVKGATDASAAASRK
jgi:hypothetical protein